VVFKGTINDKYFCANVGNKVYSYYCISVLMQVRVVRLESLFSIVS